MLSNLGQNLTDTQLEASPLLTSINSIWKVMYTLLEEKSSYKSYPVMKPANYNSAHLPDKPTGYTIVIQMV